MTVAPETADGSRRLAGKTAIITGGGRGLGRAIALEYALQGARVAVCGRQRAPLDAVAHRIREAGGSVLVLEADVTRPDHVEVLARRVVESWGRIDVLVNNAGVAPPECPVLETSPSDWSQVLAVNLTGPYLCTRAVAEQMRRQGDGSVINVSSRLGRGLNLPGWGVYSVSKWGVEGLTRCLAEELREAGIRVNAVAPGLIATELSRYQGSPPESVVDVFVFLASGDAAGVSGKSLTAGSWKAEMGLAER